MFAIYARQSIDKKDSISIETQIEFCRKEISSEAKYKIYQDKGYSGKNTDRPAFTLLMDDVEKGIINKIVVYRLDRISRSITDFASIMDKLGDHHVDFLSSTEKFDTSTPMGRAMLYIVMVFAQLERETIAERIKDNYYARGEKGVWLGGPAPYGYKLGRKNVNGKNVSILIPTEDLKIVKWIYKVYADTNKSLGGLAKELKRKEPNQLWNNIRLARILHNPAYVKADADIYHFYQLQKCVIINNITDFLGEKGCSLYGKRDSGKNKYRNLDQQVLSLALHDGIIDSATWLRCQEKMNKNTQIKNTGKGKHSWLTGLIKCGNCGYAMGVKVSNGKKYLKCTGKYNNQCSYEHPTHYLDTVEKNVQQEMKNYIKEISTRGKIAPPTTSDDKAINDLKIKLHAVETQIENLINSIASGNEILQKYANEKIDQLDKSRTEILNQLTKHKLQPAPRQLPDMQKWETFDLEEKRAAAQALINKILLYADHIDVIFKL